MGHADPPGPEEPFQGDLGVTPSPPGSSAAAWLVPGALHPDANISLIDVGLNPTRTAVIEVLREMGADIV
ncbi:MAG: 3-phosphoshikimate 1-carboxyvinyltransferase, partial [Pirellulales bacterium]